MKRWSWVIIGLLVFSIVPVWALTPVHAATYVSIQEIQSNTVDGDASVYDGQEVTTRGVVTAVTSKGFFIQNGTGPWSGIYVFIGSAPSVNIGDYVEVTGTVDEYYGLTQIANPVVTVLETNVGVPEPVVLKTGDVAQEQWESVLVKVENVVVTNPDLGYGEWEVDDGSGPVRVDDLIYGYTPEANQEIAYIIGPVYYSYGNFKIEPRSAEDIGISIDSINLYMPIKEIRDNWETGKFVVTSGIVIGTKYNGFFIQNGTEPNSGIYVYTGSTPSVQIGDVVQVNGTTAIYKGLYEISNPSYRVIGKADLPDPVLLKVGDMNDGYQSMLVKFEWVRVIDVDGKLITITDETGSLFLYDQYRIMEDIVPGRMLEYLVGIGYRYYDLEVYPVEYSVYVPSIRIESVTKPSVALRGIPMDFEIVVMNNGELGDNVTIIVYANDEEILNVTAWLDSGDNVIKEFVYIPRELGDLKIDIQLRTDDWGIVDERIYYYRVRPNPNAIAYGLTMYYGGMYAKELYDLDELYQNLTSTVEELRGYGVSFDEEVLSTIEWINSSMSRVIQEYALYKEFESTAKKTGFYLPAMIHLRTALFLGQEVKQEIEFILPHLQRVLQDVKALQQQENTTSQLPENETQETPGTPSGNEAEVNMTISIPKVLIDASHGQYYVEQVGVSYLVNLIENELGWVVDIGTEPLTLDLLEKYDVVIILNPKINFKESEIEALHQYIENGGGLFIAGEWYKYLNADDLNAIVGKYGITFNKDELMDDDNNSGRPYYPFVGIYNRNHPIMEFVPDDWTMYYNGNTLTISGNAVWLIKGYDTSYSVNANGEVIWMKGTGPIIAAAVEAGQGRIVAYGSSKALSDSYNFKYIESNWPFIKGALLWLANLS